jgi:hypothetical protein
MDHHQVSGAAGNEFGRANAKKLAEALGATLTRPGSNEARLEGRVVVLKSAAERTNSVGVTYMMLERVEEVIAALQRRDGQFDCYALTSQAFRSAMTPTRSKGSSAGRVGIVQRTMFESHGRHLGVFRLP